MKNGKISESVLKRSVLKQLHTTRDRDVYKRQDYNSILSCFLKLSDHAGTICSYDYQTSS